MAQQHKEGALVDLYGEEVDFKIKKTTFVITFSTLNCHDCYLQLARFLDANNVWTNKKVQIVAIVSDFAANLESGVVRKHYYNNIIEYFPQIKKEQVHFNSATDGDTAELFSHKFSIRSIPKVITINKDSNTLMNYDDFIKQGIGL